MTIEMWASRDKGSRKIKIWPKEPQRVPGDRFDIPMEKTGLYFHPALVLEGNLKNLTWENSPQKVVVKLKNKVL